jgi:hypothetical protein
VASSKQADGLLIKPKRVVDSGDVLTPAEGKKLRHALQQVRQRKTKPLAKIKHEMGL